MNLFSILLAAAQILPPAQPKTGPGGAEYSHQAVVSKSYGKGGKAYWLFEPSNPAPTSAPVIVFNHGWILMEPRHYDAWIEHLVKRGNIVIFPRYQNSAFTSPTKFAPNAAAAIKDAIQRLGRVQPDLSRVAMVGHSMGGIISANLAALWRDVGLPQPKAVMCAEPGGTRGPGQWMGAKLEDLSRIAPETLLLCVAGDRDSMVGSAEAKRIFKETTQVPATNKSFVVLQSDDHGKPALVADHFAVCAPSPVKRGERVSFFVKLARAPDALDFYGTWKLFDALCDAAFYGRNRQFALGNTPEQRFMGTWSDGAPVKELKVVVAP
ncbi:MAG: alpha/beta hydrolase [Verrucomicrobia bacterium]|nr:alpha/beta hydrolase [Verrucomicrobiota bacterium]